MALRSVVKSDLQKRKKKIVSTLIQSVIKLAVVQNSISKPNTKNYSKMILKRMKLLKRQFLVTKKQSNI